MTHHNGDQAPRSVAPVAREASPAEQIRALLAELHDRVQTSESIPTYRRVRRSLDREVAVLDFRPHRTAAPGLLAQLGVIAKTADTARVDVHRWQPDEGDTCEGLCAHGRWVHARTERRAVPGVVEAGGAIPGGSPGWDADGALSPLTAGGPPEAAEPIAEAWHVAEDIAAELTALGVELHEQGWRPPMTLVDIALADEPTGRRIVSRLRGLVRQARIAANYDAPIVALRDVCCPECGGELRVRTDASSAVWCSGSWYVEGPAPRGEAWPVRVRCGSRWPRGAWVRLLEDTTDRSHRAS